jgi:hypothetical protein
MSCKKVPQRIAIRDEHWPDPLTASVLVLQRRVGHGGFVLPELRERLNVFVASLTTEKRQSRRGPRGARH